MSGWLRRWWKFLATIAVSVFFAGVFIARIDLDEVVDALGDADYFYVLPALLLFAMSVILRALRWRAFLLPTSDLSWRELLPSVLIGYAGNNLLPLRAGELVRAQHLADRFAIPRMRTFGALIMERLFDGAVLATFLLWGLLLADAGTAYLGAGVLLAVGAAAGFLVCVAAARNPALPGRVSRLPLPLLSAGLRAEIASLGGSFLDGFSVLRGASRFSLATVTSVAAWGLELAMYWLIAEGFDIDASFSAIAFAGAAANVSLSLPLAQGGVGAFEVLATEALVSFDVPQAGAAAYALALHFFLIAPVSLVGLAVLWRASLPGARRRALPEPILHTPE
jgi:hypothetical protein